MFGLFQDLLPVGTQAPDFSLPESENGRTISLQQLRGRFVMLVWYPGDDTSVCTKQLCEIRDHWGDYQKLDVAIYGVNPQSSESHEKFRAKFEFPFPLLVDKGQTVGKLYHAASLMARRTVYLIDPAGKIIMAERGRPGSDQMLRIISEHQAKPGL